MNPIFHGTTSNTINKYLQIFLICCTLEYQQSGLQHNVHLALCHNPTFTSITGYQTHKVLSKGYPVTVLCEPDKHEQTLADISVEMKTV